MNTPTNMKRLISDEHTSLFVWSMSVEENGFIIQNTGSNVIKLFTAIIYEILKWARVFVPCKAFPV